MVFPVVMYRSESWTIRRLSAKELMFLNCCVGEDSWESLGQLGNQTSQSWKNKLWIFIGRTDAEAEAPILWPPDMKNLLIWKGPSGGKDWKQKEKGMAEDEMVGLHQWLNGHEFEQTLGDSRGREARRAAIHRVTKSWTRMSHWTELRMMRKTVMRKT